MYYTFVVHLDIYTKLAITSVITLVHTMDMYLKMLEILDCSFFVNKLVKQQ